jgi:hypothetical protein
MSMICTLRPVSDSDLAELFASPVAIEDFLDESDESGGEEDIDKSWHGLHYLLTRSAWEGDPPLNFLVTGGREIGDVDVGYGPARGFTSAEVAEIAGALGQISTDDLRGRFDPEQMMKAQIYPEIWDRDPGEDDTLGYLVEYFEGLKAFLQRTAASGSALVVYLN